MLNILQTSAQGLGAAPPVLGTTATVVDGTTYELDDLPMQFHSIYEPQVMIHKGYGYVATQKNHLSSDGKLYCMRFNINDLDDSRVTLIDDDTADRNFHNVTTIVIDDNDYIYIMYSRHGQPSRYWKSIEPENINAFTYQGLITANGYTNLAYPTVTRFPNGEFMMQARETLTRIILIIADDQMSGWNTSRHITEHAVVEVDPYTPINPRFYSMHVTNHTWGGNKVVAWAKREYSGVFVQYIRNCFATTPDGITFTSLDGLWSKNIVTEGVITNAEMIANLQGNNQTDLSEASSYHMHDREPINGHMRFTHLFGTIITYWWHDGSVWSSKRIDNGALGGLPLKEWIFNLDGSIDLFIRENNGINRYVSNDNLDTMTFVEVIFNYPNDSRDVKKAYNSNDHIAENTILCCSSFKDQAFGPTSNPLQNDLQVRLLTD